MNILHVIPSYLPIVGGAEINVYHLSQTLANEKLSPVIMTWNLHKRWDMDADYVVETHSGVPVIRCPGLNFLTKHRVLRGVAVFFFGCRFIPMRNVRRYFREADVIHYHDEVDLSFAVYALGIRKPKIMHIRTIGFLLSGFKKSLLRRKLLKWSADKFICNSTASSKALRELGIESKKIEVIPNGVDTSIFSQPKVIIRKPRRVIFAGRMEQNKGLHILFEALKKINKPLDLVIAVAGITNEDYHDRHLREAAELTRKFGHTIEWKYKLSQSELAALFQSAQLFVCSSINEPFGNVIIESMACGTPVIASNKGGPLDIIEHNKDGLLFRQGSADELVAGIELLLASEELRGRLAKEALSKIQSQYAWPIIGKKIIAVYKELAPNVDVAAKWPLK